MGRAAKLASIDAVQEMTAALRTYGEEVTAALADLELEVRRAIEWIRQDRKLYWTKEVRLGWDRVGQARQELERHRILHKVAGHEPGCREEKKALDLAKRRLRTAEEKVEAVRRWSRTVEKEAHEYRGSVNQLARWLQADLPRAVAALHRMTGALESYVRMKSPADALEAQRLARLAGAGRGHAEEEEEQEAAESPATEDEDGQPPVDVEEETVNKESPR